MSTHTLYNGRDPRELPAYSIADAARFLDVPSATLRSWVAGRTYPRQDGVGSFERIISPADSQGTRLSFYNVVEAHVLCALRTTHAVPLRHIRPAIAYAEKSLGIRRLLLSQELHTAAGELFIDQLGQLVNLSKSGQLYIKQILSAYLTYGRGASTQLSPMPSRCSQDPGDDRTAFHRQGVPAEPG